MGDSPFVFKAVFQGKFVDVGTLEGELSPVGLDLSDVAVIDCV